MRKGIVEGLEGVRWEDEMRSLKGCPHLPPGNTLFLGWEVPLSSPYRVLCKAVGMVLVDTPHLLPAVKMEPWVLSPPHHHHHKANRESDDDCCYDDGGDDDLHFGGGVVCLPLCYIYYQALCYWARPSLRDSCYRPVRSLWYGARTPEGSWRWGSRVRPAP